MLTMPSIMNGCDFNSIALNGSIDLLPKPIAGTSYRLVWNDEFDGTSLDLTKWNTGLGPWGNHPASTSGCLVYNKSHSSVANSLLTITLDRSYGSANWVSNANGTWTWGTTPLASWLYCFVEVRAKLPESTGKGLWPGIWMRPAASLNLSDEIDIIEWGGNSASIFYSTYHDTTGAQHQALATAPSGSWLTDYHLFQMLWDSTQINFYVDNNLLLHLTSNITSRAMCILLNYDVDCHNAWFSFTGGTPNSTTPTPTHFNIDYVRIFQKP